MFPTIVSSASSKVHTLPSLVEVVLVDVEVVVVEVVSGVADEVYSDWRTQHIIGEVLPPFSYISYKKKISSY